MSYEQMKELEKDFVLISLNDLPEKQVWICLLVCVCY